MNSWVAVWFKPKKTIKEIVEKNPNKHLWFLSFFFGLIILFQLFQFYSMGWKVSFGLGLFLILIFAPIVGWIYFSIAAWLIAKTGKLIKGKADFYTVRAAVAWSSVPMFSVLLTWVLMLILFGAKLFVQFPAGQLLSVGEIYFLLFLSLVQVVFVIWSLVVFLHALAEVQKFSLTYAVVNLLITGIVLVLVLFILWILGLYLWVGFI